MGTPQVEPNSVIDVGPLGTALAAAATTTLFENARLKIKRLVIRKNEEIPLHEAHGEITSQCLEGRVVYTIRGIARELVAGKLIYLAAGEPHSLKALDDSSLLITIQRSSDKQPLDEVQEASEESFPASDPPAWTPVTRP